MTDDKDLPDLAEMYKDTSCYTYKVTMIVQVIAPTEEIAGVKLDRDGGYVSKRDVSLINKTFVYTNEDLVSSKNTSNKKDKKE